MSERLKTQPSKHANFTTTFGISYPSTKTPFFQRKVSWQKNSIKQAGNKQGKTEIEKLF